MDLHDFADVAVNYDYYLSEMTKHYLDGFEEFHLSLADRYGSGGVLDIACGTGALTVPFVRSGYNVTAFDLSAPMVEVTGEKLRKENLTADLLAANMVDFKAGRKFSLAVIARSGFMHLTSVHDQRRTLMNIRDHLTDGGVLTLNHFQPNPAVQAEQMKSTPDNYVPRIEYINRDGKKERIYNALAYDYHTQVVSGNWRFDTLDDDGNVIESRIRPIAMRHTYRQEMEYLFEMCGYETLDVYNNYRCDPAKDNFIWVVKKS